MGSKRIHVQGCWTKGGILHILLVILCFRISSFSVPYGPSCSLSATSEVLMQRTCVERKASELHLSLREPYQKNAFATSFSDEWDELPPPSTSQGMQELRNMIPLFMLHPSFPAHPELVPPSSQENEERARYLAERLRSGLLDTLWQEPATQSCSPARYLCGPPTTLAVSAILSSLHFHVRASLHNIPGT
jgi:hypothetical protein